MKCKRERCTRIAAHQGRNKGLCDQHYRLVPRGYVDSGPSSKHLVALNRAGFAWCQIAELTGLTEQGLYKVRDGQRVQVDTQTKILSIPLPERFEGRGRVDSIGVQRRIQALVAMGWTQREQELRMGITYRRLATVLLRPQIYTPLARRIVALYDELSMTHGPSTRSRAIAKRKGWAVPLAWSDDTIDDPTAVPDTGEKCRVLTFPEKLQELRDLEIHNPYEQMRMLGYESLRSFERQLDRLGLRETA